MKSHLKLSFLTAGALSLAAGCGDDAPKASDAANDADGQGEVDATTDASEDGSDAEDDADAAADTAPDAASDSSDATDVEDGAPDAEDTTDAGPADADVTPSASRAVFVDDYGAGVAFKAFGGSTNAIAVDTTVAHAGASSLRIDVPAAGYTGGAFALDVPEDLSAYDAVVFWAKASAPYALNVVGSGNDAASTIWQVEWGGVALTTEWQRFVVPLPDPSRLTAETGLFHFAEGAEAAPYAIWLDDVALVAVEDGLVTDPTPAIATESIRREIGATATVNGASVSYLVDGAPQTLSVSRGFLAYASSDTAVATVDAQGLVTAVGLGTADITATFDGAAASGSLRVEVIDANAPSAPAPAPTAAPADVTSLFSDAYDDAAVDTWSAPWDVADVTDVTVVGDAVKKYSGLVFAGVEFTSAPIDASSATHFHIDVWTPDATEFKVKLVDFGANGIYQGSPNDDSEHELTFNASTNPALATGRWVSLDVPLSAFAGLAARAHLAQMILVSSNATVYVDNVYFHRVAAPTAPTTAAPAPTLPDGDVLNLFSDGYPGAIVSTWSASWDQADVADVTVAGNATKHYSNLVFAGIEFTSPTLDATAMTHFHIDVWTPDATFFKVKLVDFGPNGGYQGSPNDDSEHELTFDIGSSPALVTGAWVSLDIPMSAFSGLASRAHLAQMILVSSNASVFVDNIYFHK